MRNGSKYDHKYSRLYLDLHQFQVVSDAGAQAAVDELIRQNSKLLQNRFPKRDTLTCLDGDEFGNPLGDCLRKPRMRGTNKVRQATTHLRFAWLEIPFLRGCPNVVGAFRHSIDCWGPQPSRSMRNCRTRSMIARGGFAASICLVLRSAMKVSWNSCKCKLSSLACPATRPALRLRRPWRLKT
ncbi:MAG: diguanylate cyclase [Betaproteobacteria bacterium]|nr:MAG: diguanylate cyclase [Betaproteobacteria bacterium]